jgi:cholesterol transport system auxiliary component
MFGLRPPIRLPRHTAAAIAGLSVLLLAGCSALSLQQPAPSGTYVLEAEPPGPLALDPQGPTLLVERPTAAAGYDGADMLYVRKAHQLEHFAHHRWADTPAQMLQPLLVAAAEASGRCRAVITSRSRQGVALRLDTELVRLRQDFRQTPSRVELVVRLYLFDARSGEALASRLIEIDEPTPDDTPYGGVLAANRAAARLLEDLTAWLRTALAEG